APTPPAPPEGLGPPGPAGPETPPLRYTLTGPSPPCYFSRLLPQGAFANLHPSGTFYPVEDAARLRAAFPGPLGTGVEEEARDEAEVCVGSGRRPGRPGSRGRHRPG